MYAGCINTAQQGYRCVSGKDNLLLSGYARRSYWRQFRLTQAIRIEPVRAL
jgi:hypothetical protein